MKPIDYIRKLYTPVKLTGKYAWSSLFVKPIKDPKKEIPIIINNFNQYDYLLRLIKSLEIRGYENIIILDNASTYPPLLHYYDITPYRVIRLEGNYGFLSLWKSGVYKEFHKSYFVYTDPDLELEENVPDGFLSHFLDIMKKHPFVSKVGFSLKIDDLPDHFENKQKVLDWESKYWRKEIEPGVFKAQIDTTFALYRPLTKYGANPFDNHYRVGKPYVMRHLPWYVDPSNLSENMKYYIQHTRQKTHWTKRFKN